MRKKKEAVDWKDMPEGYEKYQAYIKSPEWKAVAFKVRERDKVCRCCGRTEDQEVLTVHHSTYRNLYNEGEHLEELILLCKRCHIAIHRVKSNYQRFNQSKPKKVQKKS